LKMKNQKTNMAILNINTHEELLSKLKEGKNNYLLLYKKGSELSECSYNSLINVLENHSNIDVMAANVNEVRDIHSKYGISSVPTLMIFKGDKFIKAEKGCNDESFYKSLFESSLYTSTSTDKEKPQKRVKVYSTPSCSWCTTLKKHLDLNGIKYTDIDVSKNQSAAEEMVKKSGQQGVPQTDIGGQIIVGFDKNRINSLLGIN